MENTAGKAIITVVGKDTVGIIAKICTYLANNRVNVLDISQTIEQGFFNMMRLWIWPHRRSPLTRFSGSWPRSARRSAWM